MDDTAIRAASETLVGHWMAGTRIDALPESIRPQTRAEGYAVQALLDERSGRPPHGWKIAATSLAGQAHIAVDGPLAGRILRERLVEPGGVVPPGPNHMAVAEIEFAFRIGMTLEPRLAPYRIHDVLAAVASLHLAIEIPDSRYDVFERAGEAQLIADNACAHWFVIGPAVVADWRAMNLAEHVVLGRINGGPPHDGAGRNVLGDPRVALTWLANELSQNGIPLLGGQFVSTGTCLTPMAIAPGDHVRGDFGALGSIEVTIG